MDFVKGNEIVKIDPHAIDLCGNNHITLGTELITLNNEKVGSNAAVTTLAPDYIKFGGYDSTQPNAQEGLVTFNRGDGKLTTYINGAWTNILTGTTSTSTINDSRIKITGAHNTVANGIYNKNDTYTANNTNGDVYVNENGCQLKRSSDYQSINTINWTQGVANTILEDYEYFIPNTEMSLIQHIANANSLGAHLTSINSAEENTFIMDQVIIPFVNANNITVIGGYTNDFAIGMVLKDEYSDHLLTENTSYAITSNADNNMLYFRWLDGSEFVPNKGNFVNFYSRPGYESPRIGQTGNWTIEHMSICVAPSGYDVEYHGEWLPATSRDAVTGRSNHLYRGIYKRRRAYNDVWSIYYDILGTNNLLYKIYYTNTSAPSTLIGSNILSSDISGYDYINNNKSISNDTINLSTIIVNLDPVINIAVNHPIYGGTYTTASSLSNNHHLEWNYGNYKIAWAAVDDNTNLNTNKLGWCLFDNSVIKYYSSGMTVGGITSGSSNPWDTDLRWEAVDGVNLTLPIINASNLNTSLEKNLQDWVINITDSSYEKANGTYRRDRSENINNRHVYYNEHGLKLYYGALEYDGETPNNNTVTVSSYTEGDWVSSTSNSFMQTGYHGITMTTQNNPDALVGYEIKVTNNTYATWDDAEAAAQNEYAHLASFQTFGEADHIKRILDSASTATVWFGMYYDGTAISSDGSDPNWKFTDRTRTFAERGGAPTDAAGIVWETGNPDTSETTGTFINANREIGNEITSNQKAVFKRPQMWVQGTGSLTEYEYLFVNVTGYTWQQHENKAQELGGHLISIHSSEELQFIKTKFGSVVSTAQDNNIFIGLRTSQPDVEWNATTNNDWHYTDGTPFDYDFWMVNTYPRTDSNISRYGTAGVTSWDLPHTPAEVYMFNNRLTENCIAIYKRKRNSWRIVDDKDTIYRFGEPTVTNTGSYVDTVAPLVMQPKYRNDHADESSRVVDAQDKALTVANLTITGHGETKYNGVYNYSNFKTDSTRKWVKSDTTDITIEYKENSVYYDPSGYRWQLLNSNGTYPNNLVKLGPYVNDPWDTGNRGWATSQEVMDLKFPDEYVFSGLSSSFKTIFTGLKTERWRGPNNNHTNYETIQTGIEFTCNDNCGWAALRFSEVIYYHDSPGIVTNGRNAHVPAQGGDFDSVSSPNTGYCEIAIVPGNIDMTNALGNGTNGDYSTLLTDRTNIFGILYEPGGNRWITIPSNLGTGGTTISSDSGRYYKSNIDTSFFYSNASSDHRDAWGIEIENEIVNGENKYYVNFTSRKHLGTTDKSNINWPFESKTQWSANRYELPGGDENTLIKHGYRIVYMPYMWTGNDVPLVAIHRLYHDTNPTLTKVVTATTN
ncbi:MAG: C-type lectin domain-containing protein, partial [Limisphaerales bacterium]